MKRLSVILLSLLALIVISPSSLAITVGFSQIGNESGWRTSETAAVKAEAKKRGIKLKYSDAQQKQSNQIKAIRSFIARGVDGILLAPVVEDGWEDVLNEAKRANIPVILLDRGISVEDQSLYLTKVASDFVIEGEMAAKWVVEKTGGTCKVVELQGTTGSTAAMDRQQGFANIIKSHPKVNITHSMPGDFTSMGGKRAMEDILKETDNGKEICAVYSHNDDMAIGAIMAIKAAGLSPSKDILIISIDAVPAIFKAMLDGETNATIELKAELGGPAFDALDRFLAGQSADIPKWIKVQGDLFLPADAAEQLKKRMSN